MIRITIICLSVFLLLSAAPAMATTLELPKKAAKELKKKVQELEKEGWTVYHEQVSLKDGLEKVYDQQAADDQAMQLTGFGKGKTEQVAVRQATLQVSKQYASMKGSNLKSNAKTTLSSTADSEKERLESTYTANTSQRVKQIKPALCLVRPNADGTFEAQVFCVVK